VVRHPMRQGRGLLNSKPVADPSQAISAAALQGPAANHAESGAAWLTHSPLGVHAWDCLDVAPVVCGGGVPAGHKAEQVAGQGVLPPDDPAPGAGGVAQRGVVAGIQSAYGQ
jgi:hypothetical protein